MGGKNIASMYFRQRNVLFLHVVAAFYINHRISIEHGALAACAESAAVRIKRNGIGFVYHFRHLAGHKALVYQLIKLKLLIAQRILYLRRGKLTI